MDNGAEFYRRYNSGDDKALTEMIRMYKDGLILYINGIIKNIHIAEDITEDVFVLLAVKRPKYSGKSKFKTWLYTIARNRALDNLRKSSKMSDRPIDEYVDITSEQDDFERAYLREENRIAVHSAMKKLSQDYRQVLYLVFFEEFSNSEAAAIMKKSKHQLENLLYRAKKSLKTQLEREGFIYEELY